MKSLELLDPSGWRFKITAPDVGNFVDCEVRRPEGELSLCRVGLLSVLEAADLAVQHVEGHGVKVVGRGAFLAVARAADAKRAGRRNIPRA